MSTQDIYAHFLVPEETGKIKTLNNIFLKNVYTRYKKQLVDFMDKTQKYITMMIEKRDALIKYVFKNKGDSVVNCPVAFHYIIGNIQGQCNISISSLVDITLLEALEMIEHCYENLSKIKQKVDKVSKIENMKSFSDLFNLLMQTWKVGSQYKVNNSKETDNTAINFLITISYLLFSFFFLIIYKI
jgi:hypothetical protein